MARLASLSPRAVAALAAGAVLLYAIAVWFLVVSPKRSEAAQLSSELAAAEVRLVNARAAANRPRTSAGTPVSDVLRLAKAIPEGGDQPGLVLELTRLARSSRVTIRSMSAQPAVVTPGAPTTIPVEVTVSGSFARVSRFLQRTRTLVTVQNGKLRATGRLLAVRNVELVESTADGFPLLDAKITLAAFVYDGPITAAPAPTPAEPEGELPAAVGRAAIGRTS